MTVPTHPHFTRSKSPKPDANQDIEETSIQRRQRRQNDALAQHLERVQPQRQQQQRPQTMTSSNNSKSPSSSDSQKSKDPPAADNNNHDDVIAVNTQALLIDNATTSYIASNNHDDANDDNNTIKSPDPPADDESSDDDNDESKATASSSKNNSLHPKIFTSYNYRKINSQQQANDYFDRRLNRLSDNIAKIDNKLSSIDQVKEMMEAFILANPAKSSINIKDEAKDHHLGAVLSIPKEDEDRSQLSALPSNNNYFDSKQSSKPTPSLPATIKRQPIDLPPNQVNYQGRDMITSPVLLTAGDEVSWKYSGNIMTPVKVLEVTEPTLIRRQPIYTVQMTSGTRIGATYEVRHDDLYLSKDKATELDRYGILKANSSILTASSKLDLAAIDDVSPLQLQQWNAMNGEKFKFGTFQDSIKTLTLDSDSIVAIQQFHEALSTSMTAASKGGLLTLPDLINLSPSVKMRDLILPRPSYRHYPIAKAFYDVTARIVASHIATKSFSEKAPKAKSILRTIIRSKKDGIDQLQHLYDHRLPFLGATDFDAQALISNLKIEHNMLTCDFIAEAQEIQAQIDLSGAITGPNALLKQFMDQLMTTNVQPLIASHNNNFHKFRANTGNRAEYNEESVDSISLYISTSNPTDHRLTINNRPPDTEKQSPNHPSPFGSGYKKHLAKSSFSRPTYAAMNAHSDQPDQPQENIHDDSTVQDESEFPIPTDEEKAQIDEMIKPMYAKLKVDDETQDDKLYKELFYNAMQQSRNRVQCEACLGNHPTDACRARGPAFQDPVLRKRIEQVNAKYGDKPKNPPKPSTPPTASFAGRGKYAAMSLQSPMICPPCDDHDASTLEYHSMKNTTQVETTLDKISEDLQQALANNELNLNPKLAVIKLSPDETSTTTTSNQINDDRGLADVMQVGDYSVFNEQVNC